MKKKHSPANSCKTLVMKIMSWTSKRLNSSILFNQNWQPELNLKQLSIYYYMGI